jgi:hypothetical protein
MDFIGAIDRQYYPIALFSFALIIACSFVVTRIFITISKNEANKADELYEQIKRKEKEENPNNANE